MLQDAAQCVREKDAQLDELINFNRRVYVAVIVISLQHVCQKYSCVHHRAGSRMTSQYIMPSSYRTAILTENIRTSTNMQRALIP